MRFSNTILWCALILGLIFSSCRSSDVAQNLRAEDRFAKGKHEFESEDYLDAIEDFTAITLQFPGSAVADSAQFYLAECRFQRGEYVQAAYEYQTLKRNMPASPLVSRAQYKVGLCYYKLSPKPPLDQSYTKKAIDEFQAFLEYFPTHELASDAGAKIHELINRLAKKDYETGALYMKMQNYKAATFYFESVLEKYHDSEFAERAHVGKLQALIARKKYEEAKIDLDKFLTKYPNSEFKSTVESIQYEIEQHLQGHSAAGRVPRSIMLTEYH